MTDAGESNVTVTSTDAALFDSDADEITSVTYDKGVVVNDEPDDGDVDGDGDVDADDVVLVQQYIVGDDVDIDTDAADVDGDGDIDAGEVLRIQYKIIS